MIRGLRGEVIVWDLATHSPRLRLEKHSWGVPTVAFSPDGTMIASGSWDGTARLWDAATGEERRVFEGGAMVAFSPDGKTLAAGARLFEVETGEMVTQLMIGGNSVAFSPDGAKVATTTDRYPTVWLWDARTGRKLGSFIGHTGIVYRVSFSPDGRLLGSGGTSFAPWGMGTVKVWNLTDEAETSLPQGHDQGLLWGNYSHAEGRAVVTLSPDGKTLVIATADNEVILWDMVTGRERGRLTGNEALVDCVAISRDGMRIATAVPAWTRTLLVTRWNSNCLFQLR